MKKSYYFTLLTIIAMLISSCSGDAPSSTASQEESFKTHGQAGVVDKDSDMNILQIAASSDAHTTLAAAATAALIRSLPASLPSIQLLPAKFCSFMVFFSNPSRSTK